MENQPSLNIAWVTPNSRESESARSRISAWKISNQRKLKSAWESQSSQPTGPSPLRKQ